MEVEMSTIERWTVNSNGNWVGVDGGGVRATVYSNRDGTWSAIWNDAPGETRRLNGKFDRADEAQEALEIAEREGPHSQRWRPRDDSWVERKKGGGYYREVKGMIVSVKLAKSNSWYAAKQGALLGENGSPAWHPTAKDACRAVDEFAAGTGRWQWITSQ
jgi:hypothetical protein